MSGGYLNAGGSPWGASRIARWLLCAESDRYPASFGSTAALVGVSTHLILAHLLWSHPRFDRAAAATMAAAGRAEWVQAGLAEATEPGPGPGPVRLLSPSDLPHGGAAAFLDGNRETQGLVWAPEAGLLAVRAYAEILRTQGRVVAVEVPLMTESAYPFRVGNGPIFHRHATTIGDFVIDMPAGGRFKPGRYLADLKTTSSRLLDSPVGARVQAAGEIQAAVHREIARAKGWGYLRLYLALGPRYRVRTTYWAEPAGHEIVQWLRDGPTASPKSPAWGTCGNCAGRPACWPDPVGSEEVSELC